MPLTVRDAAPADAAAIARIVGEARVPKAAAEPPQRTEERIRKAIRSADVDADEFDLDPGRTQLQPLGHRVLVADHDGEVIGFLALSWLPSLRFGREGFIADLIVRESARNAGAGTALLAAAGRAAHRVRCSRLLLLDDTRNEAYSRDFYTKRGFHEHSELACFILPIPPEGFGS